MRLSHWVSENEALGVGNFGVLEVVHRNTAIELSFGISKVNEQSYVNHHVTHKCPLITRHLKRFCS